MKQLVLILKKQMKEYSNEVRDYLEVNGEEFLSRWSDMCKETNGRISYEEMMWVFKYKIPKVPWVDESNNKINITNFFREIHIPFKADDTHIYFP
jgi:hypothetical protein